MNEHIQRALFKTRAVALVSILVLAVDAFLRIEGFLKAAGA